MNGAMGSVAAVETTNGRQQFLDVELDSNKTVRSVDCVSANFKVNKGIFIHRISRSK